MRNVHEFDGKIHMKLDFLYTEEHVEKIINDAGFLQKMRHDACVMADQILNENSGKNVDTLNNNMDARQLFVALLDKMSAIKNRKDNEIFQQLLEEQLIDMKNLGHCQQGRTIRLWQLLQCLEY